MLSAFANIFKIPELRQRILFTLAVIVVIRIGVGHSLSRRQHRDPGQVSSTTSSRRTTVEAAPITGGSSVVGMFNLFSGGALRKLRRLHPRYHSLHQRQHHDAVVDRRRCPSLSKLAREEGGRQKITQYTRYATIVICLVQGYFYAKQFENPQRSALFSTISAITDKYGPLVPYPGTLFEFTTVICLLSGTLLLMWLGEQITDKGIGNGISMVITVNIVSRLPAAILQGFQMVFSPTGGTSVPLPFVPLMFFFLFAVIAGTIAITQAMRKVTINYARQVRGNKVYGGQSSFLPLKVNYSGVMPIIFAQSILLVPSLHDPDPADRHLALGARAGRLAQSRHALLLRLHRDDLLLLLLLGQFHVQPDPDRGGREEKRRLHSRRAPRRAHGRVPRVHHDASDARGRHLPRRAGHPARRGAARLGCADAHRPVFRRHQRCSS